MSKTLKIQIKLPINASKLELHFEDKPLLPLIHRIPIRFIHVVTGNHKEVEYLHNDGGNFSDGGTGNSCSIKRQYLLGVPLVQNF